MSYSSSFPGTQGDICAKVGDTLLLTLNLTDDSNNPLSLSAVTLSAAVRTAAGDQVATLTVVPSGATGAATVQADSTLWPVGILRCDIKAVITGGIVVHSQTFPIRMQPAVTS